MKELKTWKRFSLSMGMLVIFMALGCAEEKAYVRPSSWMKGSGPTSSGQYHGLALADLDNDGKIDIIGGSTNPGTVAIWYGEGKEGWSNPQFLPIQGDIRSVAVGDFNEDGLPDIVFSIQKGTMGLRVWINQSNRKWIRGINPININEYHSVKTDDINGDGHIDIIAANSTSDTQGGIQIWLGDGKGNWIGEAGPVKTNVYMGVALADFDKDGNIDLAGAGWGAYGSLRVWLGDGRGGWSPIAPLDVGNYFGLTTGDLNGDGNLDLLAGSYQRGVKIFLGDGKGDFSKGISPAEEGSFWKALLTDLDGDGKVDLLASSIDTKGIKAWRNEGDNEWSPITGRFPSTGVYYELAIADLDDDGLDDLCAASYGEGIKVWFGAGGFPSAAAKTTTKASFSRVLVKSEPKENAVFTTVAGFPEYRVGPGDVLEISMWMGVTREKETILIRPDGKISFSFVDDLYVNGMTPTQLDDLLTESLKRYIRRPRIDIIVKEFNSKFITIMGAIEQLLDKTSGVGTYPLKGRTTLLEMLAQAGGPTKNADLRRATVRRKTGEIISLDLYKAIIYGDRSQDMVLDAGDTIFIPTISEEKKRIYVFGEVVNPGVYPFGEEINLLGAIAKAGGFSTYAKPNSTKIIRGDITKPEVLSADLYKLLKEGDLSHNITLASGDVVYIPRRFIGDVNAFIKEITPFLNLLLYPGQFRDTYMFEKALRINYGGEGTPSIIVQPPQ